MFDQLFDEEFYVSPTLGLSILIHYHHLPFIEDWIGVSGAGMLDPKRFALLLSMLKAQTLGS